MKNEELKREIEELEASKISTINQLEDLIDHRWSLERNITLI